MLRSDRWVFQSSPAIDDKKVVGVFVRFSCAASQLAIKACWRASTAAVNVNSYPFDNPYRCRNFLQFCDFCDSSRRCLLMGPSVGHARQGLGGVSLTVLFVTFAVPADLGRAAGQPGVVPLRWSRPKRQHRRRGRPWKSKKPGFGINHSTLSATVTTAASCGAVSSMHDSYTPAGRMGADGADATSRWCLAVSALACTGC
jgi:K+-transporting ATPase ATPase A chain